MRLALLIIVGAALSLAAVATSVGPSTNTAVKLDPEARLDSARAAVTARLKDPASVRFGELRISAPASSLGGGTVVCGFVNARNGFGGYTGMAPFVFFAGRAELESDAWFAQHQLDYCRR